MNTIQQVFDYVVAHLVNQGKQSVMRDHMYDGCAYRGNRGASCAVGCLIPDHEYHTGLESLSVEEIVNDDLVPTLKKISSIPNMLQLLSSLQEFHDEADNWSWSKNSLSPAGVDRLATVAEHHGLIFNIS